MFKPARLARECTEKSPSAPQTKEASATDGTAAGTAKIMIAAMVISASGAVMKTATAKIAGTTNAAIALIAGLWIPGLVLPASIVVVGLMLGALSMHVKVRDPAIKSLPALLMLLMNATVVILAIL